MKLTLEITTPERTVVEAQVDSVTIPTAQGEITVLPDHQAMVGLVVPGALMVKDGAQTSYLAVSGGALEILPGSRCVILTDSADRAEDLEEAEIEKARARAQSAYDEAKGKDEMAYADAAAHLERELARLKVARKRSRT
jgi:F-type H+-transporting ATPase subunit epsilon